MTTTLLNTLASEVNQFDTSGQESLNALLEDSSNFLQSLKELESDLEKEINVEQGEPQVQNGNSRKTTKEQISGLSKQMDNWYKASINRLKTYNTANNRFSKNVLNNNKFGVNLDNAYIYPLNMDSYPVEDFDLDASLNEIGMGSINRIPQELENKSIRQENRQELIKAIILHLLKIGQSNIVPTMVKQLLNDPTISVDEELAEKFKLLNSIVDDICIRHDLTHALGWFETKFNERAIGKVPLIERSGALSEVEFKFHMLQFIILLNGKESKFTSNDALEAYFYSRDHFSKFLKDYLNELAPLMSLILFNSDSGIENFSRQKHKETAINNFIEKLKQGFSIEAEEVLSNGHQSQAEFVSELLNSFNNVHENEELFANLSHDFVAEYCKDLKLSSDSSLFQSVLAGHIYLPSFYKYNSIELKMKKFNDKSQPSPSEKDMLNNVASFHFELPFQLPDSNRFLFRNHPIFICPVTREQSIPLSETTEESIIVNTDANGQLVSRKRKIAVDNPLNTQVVALKYCNHLALKESVWHLSKKGIDVFKCPYCYKKHKFTDAVDAYFIDL
ncbi:transcription factor [Candida orthopsilosis Co 90-125]|uniref:Transcription factor n=1 Tax=Candida orthopsilosis (strain 90-125) TaxID=1136231 RepID=H8X007_CANO9|nr:transcription factor [Candida orthopsilosis Co 90-125]CCG22352.1 transcription factor [Candida orthopsilosis Co 90-125]